MSDLIATGRKHIMITYVRTYMFSPREKRIRSHELQVDKAEARPCLPRLLFQPTVYAYVRKRPGHGLGELS